MFDFNKYKSEEFAPRTAEVDCPELKDYFQPGDKTVWVVRNVTAIELAKIREAVDRNGKALQELVASLVWADGKQGDVLKDVGARINDQVPSDIVRRYEVLMFGSVCPEVKEKADAIMLGKNHPGVFYEITNKILELTGIGAMPGKQTPCGDPNPSGQV